MITRDTLRQYRRVTVMGLGLFGGGAGAARYFAELGAQVTVTDTASAEKLARSVESLDGYGITFVLGEHRRQDFIDADLVVTNQAVRPENSYLELARSHNIPIVTETGLALALNPAPWVGITGSAGKSTTTSLIAAMLREHDPATLLGGNIGGDLLTRVEAQPAGSPVVVELSSYQLTYVGHDMAEGDVKSPQVAVLTNLSPNHLDWHPDMDDYIAAKQSLVHYQTAANWAVVNRDDPLLREWEAEIPGRIVWSSLDDSGCADACFVDGDAVVVRVGGVEVGRFSLARFRLFGRHNRVNAVQAVAAAWCMCGDAQAIETGLAAFPGLPHRLEVVAEVGGRLFVNDSKSTTPEAACTALAALEMPKVLIAGGYDKKSPFGELGREIQRRVAGVVLLGASAGRIREAVLAAAGERPVGMATLAMVEAGDDFARAVETAWRLTPEGGAVLLSPACASWGMFVNYEERGRVFRELAAGLGKPC